MLCTLNVTLPLSTVQSLQIQWHTFYCVLTSISFNHISLFFFRCVGLSTIILCSGFGFCFLLCPPKNFILWLTIWDLSQLNHSVCAHFMGQTFSQVKLKFLCVFFVRKKKELNIFATRSIEAISIFVLVNKQFT